MNRIWILLLLLLVNRVSFGQITAMDFNTQDCKGNMQHLYPLLDNGNVVILEFFMLDCTPCITAAGQVELMRQDLLQEFPGKIKSYAFSYMDDAACTEISAWTQAAGTPAIPMDSGSVQVDYYGGMGMPTIVILGGGSFHRVLGAPYVGFSDSDTIAMATSIRNHFSGMVSIQEDFKSKWQLQSNPVRDELVILSGGEPIFGRYEVIDLSGRAVVSGSAESSNGQITVPVGQIHQGVYLFRFKDSATHSPIRFVVSR